MLKVGLTGNIGSGKSILAEIFSTLGVPVYHADRESRQFLFDPEVKSAISQHFGNPVFTGEEIDRKRLAAVVFDDPDSLNYLNSLLHPLVMRHFTDWCKAQTHYKYVVSEAAILYESGVSGEFDYVIHVSCPKETSIRRVMKRDSVRRTDVLKRMRYQMSDKEKAALSDFVIRNGGSQMLIPQVLKIHRFLSDRAS